MSVSKPACSPGAPVDQTRPAGSVATPPERFTRRAALRVASRVGAGSALSAAGLAVAGCATGGVGPSAFRPTGYAVRAFGARGDGTHDDTDAFQTALDTCFEKGGGTVWVSAGTYLIRPIEIKSRTTVHLEAGAELRATTQLSDYTKTDRATSHESMRVGLIRAEDAHDIALVGRGVVDGQAPHFVSDDLTYPGQDFDRSVTRQGEAFMAPGTVFVDGPYRRGDDRPGNLVHMTQCHNVHVEGITLKNSPTWTSHFERCTDVTLTELHIHTRDHNLLIPNDDGIDVEHCKRVRISDCDIETGDDPIAIFSSEDVTVSGCVLTTRSTGVRVGYNGPDLRNCVFSNLVIRGANRGISLFVRDVGSVENILFSNITIETQHHAGRWWGNAEPIHISALGWPGVESVGRIRNIRFHQIHAEGQAGILLWGDKLGRLEDISFEQVRLHIQKGPLQKDYGGNFDLRSTNDLKTAFFAHDIPGLFARGVRGLSIRDFKLTWGEDVPGYFSDGIAVESFEDVSIDGFSGRQAQAEGAALRFTNGCTATVRHARAAAGTDVLVRHENVGGQLLLDGVDDSRARTLVQPNADPVRRRL